MQDGVNEHPGDEGVKSDSAALGDQGCENESIQVRTRRFVVSP